MYLIFEHILVVFGVLAVALSVIFALQARRSPQSSAAWVLFIILLPYLAVPVFLVLGFRKEGKRFPPIPFRPAPTSASVTHPLSDLFTRLGAPAATGGNRFDLHHTPEGASAALDAVIAGATDRLDVLLYIVAPDDSGRRFIRQLTARARDGVAVRLNLDGLGSLRRPRAELAELVAAGGQVRVFSPLLHVAKRGRLNLRNHRKMVIADADAVWAGGRNVADDYLSSPPGLWADLSFVATGPVVRAFADVFDADWDLTPTPPLPEPIGVAAMGTAQLQLVPAGPDEPLDLLHDGLVTAIHRATQRVWIATPYFVPTEPLALALCTAAQRGVDVRLHVPVRSNQWTADFARGAYLREMARDGCRVLRYRPGMLHAKAGLIDDAGWVGSANFDVRSMLLNFELGLMIYDAGTIDALERWFQGLLPLSGEGVARASLPRRLIEGIFRLGAPIL